MRSEKKFPSLLLLAIIAGFFSMAAYQAQTPQDIFLGPSDEQAVLETPAVKKILEGKAISEEKAKIEYLIARVRQSSFQFIRNGDTHPGKRAATHLLWKYSRKLDDIKTAGDFIDKIASASSMSGEIYRFRTEDGTEYQMRDVLKNELHLLEKVLSRNQAPAA